MTVGNNAPLPSPALPKGRQVTGTKNDNDNVNNNKSVRRLPRRNKTNNENNYEQESNISAERASHGGIIHQLQER